MFVIGTNICMRTSEVGEEVPQRAEVWDGHDGWMSRGNTAIVGPDGDVIAGPLRERAAILYADLDLDTLHTHRREFDPVGHYARPDVFRLQVDYTARTPVTQHAVAPAREAAPQRRPDGGSWYDLDVSIASRSARPGRDNSPL